MNNKKTGTIVLIIIIFLAVLFAALDFFGAVPKIPRIDGKQSSEFRSSLAKSKKSKLSGKNGYIAALYIEGVIEKENQQYNQEWLLDTIADLKDDEKNKGIALYINSPGGAVYEADEVFLSLQNYKTSGKPIYTYQANIAASGGYYISCAGTKIYANRNTLTGSIGVISGNSFDVTKMLEKIGIKTKTIHSGKNKNMFNYNEPVTDEQEKIMQSISDECYEQFLNIVAMNRNIPIFQVRKIADGRIYTAKQALDNGLIDAIDTWENMINNMKDICFSGEALNVTDFKYEPHITFRDMLFAKALGKTEYSAFCKALSKWTMQYPAFLYLE